MKGRREGRGQSSRRGAGSGFAGGPGRGAARRQTSLAGRGGGEEGSRVAAQGGAGTRGGRDRTGVAAAHPRPLGTPAPLAPGPGRGERGAARGRARWAGRGSRRGRGGDRGRTPHLGPECGRAEPAAPQFPRTSEWPPLTSGFQAPSLGPAHFRSRRGAGPVGGPRGGARGGAGPRALGANPAARVCCPAARARARGAALQPLPARGTALAPGPPALPSTLTASPRSSVGRLPPSPGTVPGAHPGTRSGSRKCQGHFRGAASFGQGHKPLAPLP